jgi:hypothetical protein
MLLGLLSSSLAADSWTEPYPGVRLLHRTTSEPQVIWAAEVDLSRDELYLRATTEAEQGQTVSSWASQTGAVVALNGDWFTGSTPRGLALGQGSLWGEDLADHSFIACTAEQACEIDFTGTAQSAHWRWRNAVGGNGVLLVQGGAAIHNTDSFYSVDQHPRSAVGLSSDGSTLWLVAIQGRRSDADGMSFNATADLLVELGVHSGMMLDGGGSTALVVGGSRVNALQSGTSERSVANHLGVFRNTSADARCSTAANGFHCEGETWIVLCEGEAVTWEGDCAVYGGHCGESQGIGYCSDYRCERGGEGSWCLDETQIAGCELGRYGEGDCAAYGLVCLDDGVDAVCGEVPVGHSDPPEDSSPTTDSEASTDTALPYQRDEPVEPSPPGERVRLRGCGGLGCAAGGAGPWWLLLLALFGRRRGA